MIIFIFSSFADTHTDTQEDFQALLGCCLLSTSRIESLKGCPLFQFCKIKCSVNDCLGQEVELRLPQSEETLAWRRLCFFFPQEAVKNERKCVSREEEKMPLHRGLLAA